MKGQFMLISSIVIGLILMSTAATVSDIQSRSPNVNSIAHDINYIESEVQQTDLEDPNERDNLKQMLNSHSDYNTNFNYWESQNCLNLTLSNERNRFTMSCIGNESISSALNILLSIEDLADFESKGSYKKTNAETGNLRIGYRNGNTGDSLRGFWRMDSKSTSYSLTKTNSANSFWTAGFSPDLNIKEIESDLQQGSSSTTTVTVEASNNGSGTWEPEVELYNYTAGSLSWSNTNIGTGGGSIESLVPADINDDGNVDIVWGDDDSDNIEWAENNGDGTYTIRKIGDGDTESASVGDIDGDGDLDVISAGGGGVDFHNNTNGDGSSWTSNQLASVSGEVRSTAIGDIDGDGDLDVVYGGFNNEVNWLENDGSSSGWTRRTIDDMGNDVWSVAVGDIDGDGDLDVLASDRDEDLVWFENDGSSTPSFNQETISSSLGYDAFTLNLADITNNGNLEVFSGGLGNVEIHERDGGSWVTSSISSTSDTVRTLQLADIDLDGDLDAFIGFDANSGNGPRWLENDGSLTGWSSTQLGSTSDVGHYGLAIADYDDDGILEVMSGEDGGSSSTIRKWDTNGIQTTFIGSDQLSFTDSSGDEKDASISWTPTSDNYNLLARVNSNRSFTEVLEMNDETAGSTNNMITQSISPSNNIKDFSGEGNNGETSNFEGDERGVQGVFSTNAFDFNDNDDVVKVPDSSTLSGMDALTVSAWLKETGDPGSNYAHIISKSAESEGSGDTDWGIIQQSDGDISFRVNTGNDWSTDDEALGNDLPRDTWVHIVGTWDGGEIKLYRNGVLEATGSTPSSSLNDANGPLGIGRHAENTNQRYFDGYVDEVRIYNETLSESEVEDLYFDGHSGDFNGTYSTVSKNIAPGFSPVNLTINSTVPGPTDAEVVVTHESGSQVTKSLPTGTTYKNYSLPISEEGGSAQAEIRLYSADSETTPVINKLKIWTSN